MRLSSDKSMFTQIDENYTGMLTEKNVQHEDLVNLPYQLLFQYWVIIFFLFLKDVLKGRYYSVVSILNSTVSMTFKVTLIHLPRRNMDLLLI